MLSRRGLLLVRKRQQDVGIRLLPIQSDVLDQRVQSYGEHGILHRVVPSVYASVRFTLFRLRCSLTSGRIDMTPRVRFSRVLSDNYFMVFIGFFLGSLAFTMQSWLMIIEIANEDAFDDPLLDEGLEDREARPSLP